MGDNETLQDRLNVEGLEKEARAAGPHGSRCQLDVLSSHWGSVTHKLINNPSV